MLPTGRGGKAKQAPWTRKGGKIGISENPSFPNSRRREKYKNVATVARKKKEKGCPSSRGKTAGVLDGKDTLTFTYGQKKPSTFLPSRRAKRENERRWPSQVHIAGGKKGGGSTSLGKEKGSPRYRCIPNGKSA